MEENNGREFELLAVINGVEHQVYVVTSETTDGVPFYICRVSGDEISQVRKENGEWIQIWGDLNATDVKSIGAAIEGSVLEE